MNRREKGPMNCTLRLNRKAATIISQTPTRMPSSPSELNRCDPPCRAARRARVSPVDFPDNRRPLRKRRPEAEDPSRFVRRLHNDRLHRSYRLESEVHRRMGPDLPGGQFDQEVDRIERRREKESGCSFEGRQEERCRAEGRHQEIETQQVRQTMTMSPVVTGNLGSIGSRPASDSCRNAATPILSLAGRTTPTLLASGR